MIENTKPNHKKSAVYVNMSFIIYQIESRTASFPLYAIGRDISLGIGEGDQGQQVFAPECSVLSQKRFSRHSAYRAN